MLNKGKQITIAKRKCYQGMTDSIIFLMIETRPDIAYAIPVVSYFAKNPSHLHSKVVKIVFRYLKAKRDVGITYKREQGGDLIIKRYSDFNWVSNHMT